MFYAVYYVVQQGTADFLGSVADFSTRGNGGKGPVAVSSEYVMKYRDQWRTCIKKIMGRDQ